MIPAKPGQWVSYKSRPYRDELIAWSDDGRPMVQRGAQLTPVDPAEIAHIAPPDPYNHAEIASFTPTSGWSALYEDEDKSGLYEERMIGWGVTTCGTVVAMGHDTSEGAIVLSGESGFICPFPDTDREKVYQRYRRPATAA